MLLRPSSFDANAGGQAGALYRRDDRRGLGDLFRAGDRHWLGVRGEFLAISDIIKKEFQELTKRALDLS
jgi:hypothetical protein